MNLSYFPYELKAEKKLNSQQKENLRKGFLISYEREDGIIGYADCHPWEELGDNSFEETLESLKAGQPNELAEQSLLCARLDAQSRADKVDLLSGAFSIENHKLITSLKDVSEAEVSDIKEENFSRIKVKMSSDVDTEIVFLRDLLSKLDKPLFRLDFNNSLNEKEFTAWCLKNKDIFPRIEFIEDPFPYSENWKGFEEEFNISLAIDNHLIESDPVCSVIVLKPAKANIFETLKKINLKNHQFVITHYMDHPVGMNYALSVALKAKFMLKERLLTCGLLQSNFYSLSEEVKTEERGPYILADDDIGIGFTNYLKELPWQKL